MNTPYATAGARIGPGFLWTAPVTFPMMVAVVYLSSKLGQVTAKGLFDVIRDHYLRWVLQSALIGAIAEHSGLSFGARIRARISPVPEQVEPRLIQDRGKY